MFLITSSLIHQLLDCNAFIFSGMNAAVRAVIRMAITCGSKVYLIHEVSGLIVVQIIITQVSTNLEAIIYILCKFTHTMSE